MRLLVLGGTRFLGRHVVDAAFERGHEVATFTRGISGCPPAGVRALHDDTARARELGLPSRPLRESVADTWEWQRGSDRPEVPPGRTLPGLPADLEARLLGS